MLAWTEDEAVIWFNFRPNRTTTITMSRPRFYLGRLLHRLFLTLIIAVLLANIAASPTISSLDTLAKSSDVNITSQLNITGKDQSYLLRDFNAAVTAGLRVLNEEYNTQTPGWKMLEIFGKAESGGRVQSGRYSFIGVWQVNSLDHYAVAYLDEDHPQDWQYMTHVGGSKDPRRPDWSWPLPGGSLTMQAALSIIGRQSMIQNFKAVTLGYEDRDPFSGRREISPELIWRFTGRKSDVVVGFSSSRVKQVVSLAAINSTYVS